MRNRLSAPSACLLVSSLLVGGMGLLWLVVLVLGVVVGAGIGGAWLLSTFFELDVPDEVLWASGGTYAVLMAVATGLSLMNLVSGGIGVVASIRAYATGRTGGLRLAAGLQILMALIFGLPGLAMMNPLGLLWLAVLALCVATFVGVPRSIAKGDPG